MFKILFVFLFSFSLAFSNENVVKTSELELFLFKIGFNALLEDVEVTKDKSTLNEEELKKVNEKIELIMNELYKNNRVLLNDLEKPSQKIDNKELENLKQEIAFLKQEIIKLKEEKETKHEIIEDSTKETIEEVVKEESTKNEIKKMRVASDSINLYERSTSDSNVLKQLKRDMLLDIKWCNSFGWCKLNETNGYVRRFLIKEIK